MATKRTPLFLMRIPKLVLKLSNLILEGPEHLYYVCLSVRRLFVTPAVSGVSGADEQQKDKVGTTYSVRHQFGYKSPPQDRVECLQFQK